MPNHYPSWRYHRTLAPVLVHDPDEDAALGPEWAGTPAAFIETETEPEPAKPEPEPDPEPRKKKR